MDKKRDHPQGVLQGYFDALLGDGEATSSPTATQTSDHKGSEGRASQNSRALVTSETSPVNPVTPPVGDSKPTLRPQLQISPERPREAPSVQEALEAVKRDRLQALLTKGAITFSEPQVSTAGAASTVVVTQAPTVPVASAQPVALAPSPGDVPETVDKPVPQEIAPPPHPSSPPAGEEVSPLLAWHANGRPQWAQRGFDVLLFKVSGLTLAVPLIALGQIYPMTAELTPIFGQADWFMGLQPTKAGNLRTVNTALLVMPERYDPQFLETAKYVVSIDGMPWGLAVDEVRQPRHLQPEDVNWRTERTKRAWLAGTVKSEMCALIDIPQMGETLMRADRKRPS